MKRLLSIILFGLFVLSVSAANLEKEYKKLIYKIDVAEEVKVLDCNQPFSFWQTMLDNNEVFIKFSEDIKKNKGAEKEALEKVANLPRFYPYENEAIIDFMQGMCDTLLMVMGIQNLDIKCSLHVIIAPEVNAFTVLTNDGFAMCITSGLLIKEGLNYDILMGYVAHEFVHGALMHHIRGFYAEAKERRKNELWGGIAAGLYGLSAGIEAFNASAYGIPKSGTDYSAAIANLNNAIKISTLKYSFKFSREQEYEADLIAFRFMENLGKGKSFIDGLTLLGTEYDQLYNEYSNHPTISSRIDFLKFVQTHPELGNKENIRLKKKREKAGK